MADKEIEKLHADADWVATGADKLKTNQEVFRNAALIVPGADEPRRNIHGTTHSIGIKPHPPGIAASLIGRTDLVPLDETRPLIDLLQEATFGDTTGMQWVADKYALRMLLRKAHCFRLDSETSALVSDFSLAVANDLEAVRHMAIPPFPVTWFEVDNVARLKRIKERGVRLTQTAQREDVCTRVGWLITPATDLHEGGYYASYCTVVAQGVFVAPLSFFWHTGEAGYDPRPDHPSSDVSLQQVCFGMPESGVGRIDAFPSCTPFHLHYHNVERHSPNIKGMMFELSGELRHIWGLLLALGAGQLGAETITAPQPLPAGPPPVAKGKPVLPLEHKVLTIKLAKRATVDKVTAKAITGIKHRWHEVRGHFRTKKNPDGSIKWRIPIKPHARGDERLGKIEKTYKVER